MVAATIVAGGEGSAGWWGRGRAAAAAAGRLRLSCSGGLWRTDGPRNAGPTVGRAPEVIAFIGAGPARNNVTYRPVPIFLLRYQYPFLFFFFKLYI